MKPTAASAMIVMVAAVVSAGTATAQTNVIVKCVTASGKVEYTNRGGCEAGSEPKERRLVNPPPRPAPYYAAPYIAPQYRGPIVSQPMPSRSIAAEAYERLPPAGAGIENFVRSQPDEVARRNMERYEELRDARSREAIEQMRRQADALEELKQVEQFRAVGSGLPASCFNNFGHITCYPASE